MHLFIKQPPSCVLHFLKNDLINQKLVYFLGLFQSRHWRLVRFDSRFSPFGFLGTPKQDVSKEIITATILYHFY